MLVFSTLFLGNPVPGRAQATFTGQLTGVVTDSSGGVIAGARVTLTDETTNVGPTSTTDNHGIYVFTGIRPGTYTIKVDAADFGVQERKNVVVAVSQQATLDFTLSPKGISESITVTEQPPLLDTANAALGTDVTNEYVRDIPLPNRSMFGLVFLAGGVTETAGQGTKDCYPSGTNFVSNGQRNATAEIRVDGALTSAPEQGEGGDDERLLPAVGGNRSGIQGREQQLLRGIWEQRRDRGEHCLKRRRECVSRQRLVVRADDRRWMRTNSSTIRPEFQIQITYATSTDFRLAGPFARTRHFSSSILNTSGSTTP